MSLTTDLSKIFKSQTAATSHLSAILDGLAANSSENLDWRDCIVDLMKLFGMDSSLDDREKFATELGFTGELSDSPTMNIFLQNRVIIRIVDNHAVDVVARLNRRAAKNSEKLDWHDSVVDLMKLFGMDSSLDDREKLATKFGFTGDLSDSGTMSMWLHTRLIIKIVDNGGKVPTDVHTPVGKPKKSPKDKSARLCSKLPVKDAAIPMLLLFLHRFLKQTPPANDFEKGVQRFLADLPTDKLNILKIGLDAYDKLPPSIRECAFDTRFENRDDKSLLDPKLIFKVWFDEVLQLGTATLLNLKSGELRSGQVRPWEQTFIGSFMDGSNSKVITAPWPWICQVNPGADGNNWYKNAEVRMPGNLPLNTFIFKQHEFPIVCEKRPDPGDASKFTFDCRNQQPRDFAPIGGGFADCNGNNRYNFPDPNQGTVCLAVPKTYPGQGVFLRGLNFISPNCKARLQRVGGGFPDLVIDCGVVGDTETPLMRDGKIVASCEVEDVIMFTIPPEVKIGVNRVPVPPGRYVLQVIVPNDAKFVPTPGTAVAPADFTSNDVWLDMAPNPKQMYRIFTKEAFCIEETDGPGSDEPWFEAYSARFVPSEVGTGPVTIPSQAQSTIFRTDDIDSDDSIIFAAPDLFRDKLGINEVVAICVYGLEVDSEDAAAQQIKDFGEAYALYWKSFITHAVVEGDIAIVPVAIKAGLATGTAVAAGVAVLAAVALTGLFYAAWAPADPIGFDVMTFDSQSLFDLTNPTTPLPASFSKSFDELSLDVDPKEKEPQAGGTHAKYFEEHFYHSSDEDSTYKLVYGVERV